MSLEPRRSYNTVIHSRASSVDSRASNSTRSSAEVNYAASRSDMANGDYDRKDDRTTYYRVPDNARHYITSKTSPSGKVEVIAHEKAIHDRDAPRASESRDDYAREEREWARKQQERARRERERQERKYHEESRR